MDTTGKGPLRSVWINARVECLRVAVLGMLWRRCFPIMHESQIGSGGVLDLITIPLTLLCKCMCFKSAKLRWEQRRCQRVRSRGQVLVYKSHFSGLSLLWNNCMTIQVPHI